MASNIIRTAIAKAIFNVNTHAAALGMDATTQGAITDYANKRWGAQAEVMKSLVNPAGTDNTPLVPETLVRDEFVQAVFSASILGRLQGVIEVPAQVRVAVESTPVTAPFVGQYSPSPAFQGDFGVNMTRTRKVSITAVLTAELVRLSSNAAETVISGRLQRALSRGIDAGFVGSQARDDVSPTGLSAVAVQIPAITAPRVGDGLSVVDSKASFDAGVAAFTGDLSKASVIVNPRTAITLRSPTEQNITVAGGVYGGLPVITSYGMPVGKLFIVDGSRVVAYMGDADVSMAEHGSVVMDDGVGGPSSAGVAHLFQEDKRALKGTQYVDWDFVPGAAVEVALTA